MNDAANDWNSAKTAFDQGRLQDALNQFLKLLPTQPQDAALNFNIGNLYFRLGSYGPAVAYLEKARILSPSSSEIRTTLDLARQSFLTQTGTRDLDPSANWYERLDETLPLPAVGAGFALSALVLAIFIWKKCRSVTLISSAAILAALALAAGGLSIRTSLSKQAVCTESSTVRSGPGDSFLELSRLDSGIRVRNVDLSLAEGWAQIHFGPGKTGWVKRSTLLLLD